MPFELRGHTADVAVEAWGATLDACIEALANGLVAASTDDVSDTGEAFELDVTAESLEALLFEYLDELIYLRDVREELPVDNEVLQIDGPAELDAGVASTNDQSTNDQTADETDAWYLRARARGVPLTEIDAREVKAVTYSDMRLERSDSGWEGYVVFDV